MTDPRLADYVRALKELAPRNRATAAAIARVLGISGAEPAVETIGARTTEVEESADEDVDQSSPAVPDAHRRSLSHGAVERAFSVRRLGRVRRARSSAAWTSGVVAIPQGVPEDQAPRPPLEPLFAPGWARAMLAAIAATPGADGDPHITPVIATIASGQPVSRIPRMIRYAIRHRLDILLDVGEGMVPFARDQRQLIAAAFRVIGKDRCRVLRFVGTPGRGVWAARDAAAPYMASPDSRVLIVTDLGLAASFDGTAASAQEWRRWALTLRSAGARPVALVPYPSPRWPPAIRGALPIVLWDRPSSLLHIRRTGAHR
jgi:hypothetical protein